MAQGTNQELQGGQELSYISQKDSYLGTLLSRVISAINQTAKSAGVAAVGKVAPPQPINTINVSGPTPVDGVMTLAKSEVLHWTIQHNNKIDKGIRYFSEIDTNPGFTNPHVVHHGTSRTGFISLPTKSADGSTTHTYYLRSYAQMPGSDPTAPTVFGGLSGAIGIQMGGTSQTDILSSTGSGTAAANGSQGGKGFGDVLTRPAPQPKRNTL